MRKGSRDTDELQSGRLRILIKSEADKLATKNALETVPYRLFGYWPFFLIKRCGSPFILYWRMMLLPGPPSRISWPSFPMRTSSPAHLFPNKLRRIKTARPKAHDDTQSLRVGKVWDVTIVYFLYSEVLLNGVAQFENLGHQPC